MWRSSDNDEQANKDIATMVANMNSTNNGSNKTKKKKKKKNKKNRKQSANNGGGEHSNGNGNHKRIHDDDFNDIAPHKKQRRASLASTTTTWMHGILYVIFFILGTCITLPTLFTSCCIVGCGGRSTVNNMIDHLILIKNRDVEKDDTFLDMMQHLKSKSMKIDEMASVKEKSNRRKRGKNNKQSTEEEEKPVPSSIDIHENMCHVSFIGIAHFIQYLPFAQLLVFRNPFTPLEIDPASYHIADGKEKKGLFSHVLSKHKQKDTSRAHPIRHILEGASIFFHHRKEKKFERKEAKKKRKQKQAKRPEAGKEGEEIEVDWKKWKFAMSDDYEITSDQVALIKKLVLRATDTNAKNIVCKDDTTSECKESIKEIRSLSGGSNLPNRSFQERLDSVSWGGVDLASNQWWAKKDNNKDKVSSQSDGGRLLSAYLKIMKWPTDLFVKYPFKLCKEGCDSEVSLLHTLEWREKYKPWCMSQKAVQFNNLGFVYTRGHSKPGPKQRIEAKKANDLGILKNGGHSLVWYRPGLASPTDDPELYGRTMINTLEMAVSDSLTRNKGTIGRFNVIMDCSGMGSKNSPSIANVKKLFGVLQDHFPDRLGVILAANLSGLTQMLMKMVLPFVTEDVRAKIHIIPNGEEERREMLLQFIDEDQIPSYLISGNDDYKFGGKEYYDGKCILPEEGILDYIATMPYHA